jgi:lipopolysaccharide assembly outer membrane protein LptD (OstA)
MSGSTIWLLDPSFRCEDFIADQPEEGPFMKRLILISCSLVLALAQTPNPAGRQPAGKLNLGHGEISLYADRTETFQATIHFSGNVVIETESMSIQADQADMNRATRELVVSGPLHVRLKYLAVIAGRESLIRY